jgi:hypothetical protein
LLKQENKKINREYEHIARQIQNLLKKYWNISTNR